MPLQIARRCHHGVGPTGPSSTSALARTSTRCIPANSTVTCNPMASPLAPTQPLLLESCACRSWAAAVAARGPYGTVGALIDAAREVWWHQVGPPGRGRRLLGACRMPPSSLICVHLLQTPVTGWLEAFAAHPKIGDLEGLRHKYGGAFADMSRGEQAAAAGAPEAVLQVRPRGAFHKACELVLPVGGAHVCRPLTSCPWPTRQTQELADWNARYEAKFGHIFIVCASGKSAEEMLAIIQRRWAVLSLHLCGCNMYQALCPWWACHHHALGTAAAPVRLPAPSGVTCVSLHPSTTHCLKFPIRWVAPTNAG